MENDVTVRCAENQLPHKHEDKQQHLFDDSANIKSFNAEKESSRFIFYLLFLSQENSS